MKNLFTRQNMTIAGCDLTRRVRYLFTKRTRNERRG